MFTTQVNSSLHKDLTSRIQVREIISIKKRIHTCGNTAAEYVLVCSPLCCSPFSGESPSRRRHFEAGATWVRFLARFHGPSNHIYTSLTRSSFPGKTLMCCNACRRHKRTESQPESLYLIRPSFVHFRLEDRDELQEIIVKIYEVCNVVTTLARPETWSEIASCSMNSAEIRKGPIDTALCPAIVLSFFRR